MNRLLCTIGWWLVLHACESARAPLQGGRLAHLPAETRRRLVRRILRRLREEGLLNP